MHCYCHAVHSSFFEGESVILMNDCWAIVFPGGHQYGEYTDSGSLSPMLMNGGFSAIHIFFRKNKPPLYPNLLNSLLLKYLKHVSEWRF